jgi:tRNA pseudouridine38-40 synthase
VEKGTTKIVLTIEYDGTDYFGFQLQENRPDQPTIQSELEEAIFRLTGERLRVAAASRTDTGVHAKGQVVSFRTQSSISLPYFLSGLNHFLPADIAVLKTSEVPESFHVMKDAISREYRYVILNRRTRPAINRCFVYQFAPDLDAEAMNEASRMLVGEHDMAGFTGTLGDRIKTVKKVSHAGVLRKGDLIVFSIEANSFLPHQIRNTVGSLIQVGQGKMNVNAFYDIIKNKQPGSAGPRAPAKGLFLMRVNYSKPFGEEN